MIEIRDTRTRPQRQADALGTICDHAMTYLSLTGGGTGADNTGTDNTGADNTGTDNTDGAPGGGGAQADGRHQGDRGGRGERRNRGVSGVPGLREGSAPRIVIHTTPDQLHRAMHAHPDDKTPEKRSDAAGDPGPHGPGRPPPPVMGTSECDHLGPIPPGVLGVFACDALIERVLLAPTGAALDLGRTVRTITPAQRRALVARDRGCVFPGCTAPASYCDGHHVQWWRHGGRSDPENLALVCPRHHADIHAGHWTVQMINGVPWAQPPRWADPQRRWTRNTYHHATASAARLGTQLRLPGTGPDNPPPRGDDA
jgi:hypothetical protein